MHLTTNAVTSQITDYTISMRFRMRLNSMADITNPVAVQCLARP